MRKRYVTLLIILSAFTNLFSQSTTYNFPFQYGINYINYGGEIMDGGKVGCKSDANYISIGYSPDATYKNDGWAEWGFKLPSQIIGASQVTAINVKVSGQRCDLSGSSSYITFIYLGVHITSAI